MNLNFGAVNLDRNIFNNEIEKIEKKSKHKKMSKCVVGSR